MRLATFELKNRGYQIEAVDGAMNRLEAAFINRDRDRLRGGCRVRLRGMTASLIVRPPCTRVCSARAVSVSRIRRVDRGYSCEEVDDLLDRIAAYFDEAEELTANEIRTATFRPKRGKKAYAEGPVDAYLARAIEILLAVD